MRPQKNSWFLLSKHLKGIFWIGVFLLSGSSAFSQTSDRIQASVVVGVYNENLIQARSKALLEAKQKIIKTILLQSIEEEILNQLKSVLSPVLGNPDRFLDSIKILEEISLPEQKQLKITVGANVLSTPLLAAIQSLHIPLKTDPFQSIMVLYDPGLLTQSDSLHRFLELLQEKLVLYRMEVAGNLPLVEPLQKRLSQIPQASLESPQMELGGSNGFLVIYPIAIAGKPPTEIRLGFYTPQGTYLTHFSLSGRAELQGDRTAETLMTALLAQWGPSLLKLKMIPTENSLIEVQLLGVPRPELEEQIVSELFSHNPLWNSFNLYKVNRTSVTYRGRYQGSKETLTSQVTSHSSVDYEIQQAQWVESQLQLKVRWIEHSDALLAYQKTPLVEEWYRSLPSATQGTIALPQFMTPPQQHPVYSLSYGQKVYDRLQSRSEQTTYRLEGGEAFQTIRVSWNRIGNTNLKPILSLYDLDRNWLASYPMDQSTTFFEVPLGTGQSSLLLRVSDQIGYVEDDVQIYSSFHYLLQIDRVISDKKKPSSTP